MSAIIIGAFFMFQKFDFVKKNIHHHFVNLQSKTCYEDKFFFFLGGGWIVAFLTPEIYLLSLIPLYNL